MGDKLIKWCNHNACRIRDKAQGPSAFISQPSGQLTCSAPELRAQLNLTKKPKESDHTCKACPVTCSYVNGCGQSLEATGRLLTWCQAMRWEVHWKKWSHTAASCSTKRLRQVRNPLKELKPHGGQFFNQTTSTGENRKKASSSLYLDELLIQKCKFRRRITVNC